MRTFWKLIRMDVENANRFKNERFKACISCIVVVYIMRKQKYCSGLRWKRKLRKAQPRWRGHEAATFHNFILSGAHYDFAVLLPYECKNGAKNPINRSPDLHEGVFQQGRLLRKHLFEKTELYMFCSTKYISWERVVTMWHNLSFVLK